MLIGMIEHPGEGVIWLLICWLCAAIFTGIGVYARHSATPVHFWSGTTVAPEQVSDISAYNRANSGMWLIFSLPYWLLGVVYFWLPVLSGIGMGVWSIAGLCWLIWRYRRIQKRFFVNP